MQLNTARKLTNFFKKKGPDFIDGLGIIPDAEAQLNLNKGKLKWTLAKKPEIIEEKVGDELALIRINNPVFIAPTKVLDNYTGFSFQSVLQYVGIASVFVFFGTYLSFSWLFDDDDSTEPKTIFTRVYSFFPNTISIMVIIFLY